MLYLAYLTKFSDKTRGLTLDESLIFLFEWKRTFKRTLVRTVMSVLFKPQKQKYSHKLNGIDPYTAAVIIGLITGWMIGKYFDKD